MTIYLEPLILRFTAMCIFISHLFKPIIKMIEKFAKPFRFFIYMRDGFKRRVQRAGVNDKAIKAERITEIAMVIANC